VLKVPLNTNQPTFCMVQTEKNSTLKFCGM